MTEAVGTRKLTTNSLWNLAGVTLPLAVGLIAIPLLIRGLGVDRFGVLQLAWTVIGYFSLLDLGLGRALTQVVAQRLEDDAREDLLAVARSALVFMAVLGFGAGLLAIPASNWYVRTQLNVAPELMHEALRAFHVLAASVPVVILTAGLRGVLEGMHAFRVVNAIRIPLGLLTFLGPVAILPFDPGLPAVVGVLLGSRLLGLSIFAVAVGRALPGVFAAGGVRLSETGALLRMAGWMAVSNVIGPLMVVLDRYVIGARMTLEDVSYYTTPYEAVTRTLVVPAALVGVLFPAFATLMVKDPARARRLYDRGWAILLGTMGPLMVLVVAFAPEGLEVWLDADFAREGTTVLRWLALGVLLNTVARVPFVLIQGAGRPKLTALTHLVELPIYLWALGFLLERYGIDGAAMAWTGRIALDLLFFGLIGHRMLPTDRESFAKTLVPLLVSVLAMGVVLGLERAVDGWWARAAVVALVGAASPLWLWRSVLGDDLRSQLLGWRSGR